MHGFGNPIGYLNAVSPSGLCFIASDLIQGGLKLGSNVFFGL